jgi:FMN phosphatase YigB (HAD superfamily)
MDLDRRSGLVRGILFDLDGTLLDIELSGFIPRYFAALTEAASAEFPGVDLAAVIGASTEAMMRPHPGVTNHDAFWADFASHAGADAKERWPLFDRFYAERFPSLGKGTGPKKGARRAVETAIGLGFRVAIATNPIFPMAAVRHRLAWAGLDDIDFPVVTAYEGMHATKPFPAYFRETAELLGVAPAECLMVGDDPVLDMGAADIGMMTFNVGGRPTPSDYTGDLDDLADLLERLAGDAP